MKTRAFCTPTANDIVRIHITSWRTCVKSFRRLEVFITNQSTLEICKNRNVIVVSSQIRVFVCINPFHRIDLATCFGELTHFFICQNSTSIDFHPLVPFGASRLSEGSLHIGRAGWEVKVSFTVLLLQHLLVAFCASQLFSLEEIHFSDVRIAPFFLNTNETSCSVSTPFFAVLAFFRGSFVLFLRFIRGSH